ncbi:hypothetical protein SYYSPA8_31375 [Streptomyces yaizuensis]|uniref:Uncharacterized protein n=1 Tax=Streptomyces yaizuensis TaxID=2989713 RepID=A0ABQ5P8I6_9ACTN|nr:hypothetical protein SYYSPA8_31375 [Streptomyces sp. YSPA8]
MDAERLILASRHALAQSRTVPEIVAEAWQAQALAQAIGGRIAVYGPLELRAEARGLAETGARGTGALDHPGPRGGSRAVRLSGVADAREALLALGALLAEVGMALVSVACGTDDEGLYWQCVEAIDAADESTDRVRGMLRRIAEREAARPPDGNRGRAGPPAARSRPARPAAPAPTRSAPRPADLRTEGPAAAPASGLPGARGPLAACEAVGARGTVGARTATATALGVPDTRESAAGSALGPP